MRMDEHLHSDNSPDAEHSVVEMCISAIEKKFDVIAVTDHCEVDRFTQDGYDRSVRQSFFDMLKATDVFQGRLEILRGIELGNATCDFDLARDIVRAHPYDIVLGSLHHVKGLDDFAFLDYTALDIRRLLLSYFDEMAHMVEWGQFDVLAHLTYPLRYIVGEAHIEVDITDYEEPVKRVLQSCVARGIGLEINTSGLRQPYGHTLPGLWAVRLYRRLGGTRLSVGSDAHTMQDLGAGIETGLRLAQEAGFDSVCVWRARHPVPVPIAL